MNSKSIIYSFTLHFATDSTSFIYFVVLSAIIIICVGQKNILGFDKYIYIYRLD